MFVARRIRLPDVYRPLVSSTATSSLFTAPTSTVSSLSSNRRLLTSQSSPTPPSTHSNQHQQQPSPPPPPPPSNNNNDNNNTSLLPGLALSGSVAGVAFLGSGLVASIVPISAIPIAILSGAAINTAVSLPASVKPGVTFASKPVLQAGIVCLGAKLSVLQVASLGAVGVPVVAASIASGLLFIPWLGARLKLPHKVSTLLAAGTSICGVTAISAVAPVIRASPQDVSYAVSAVVAMGTCNMLLYPYLAHAAFDASHPIGMFLGLAVHDTSQVVGAAMSYAELYNDPAVLESATVTKLTRNLFLTGVIPLMGVMAARQQQQQSGTSDTPAPITLASLSQHVPGFVLAFVGVSCLRSAGDYTLGHSGAAFGVLDADAWSSVVSMAGTASTWCLATALAGVGLGINLASLRGGELGARPFVLGLAGSLVVGTTAFTCVSLFNGLGWLPMV